MGTDPSWLYSTIAQSSAAIVAIIGGFITASVLMLMSEKRNLKHQLADKKAHLEVLEGKLQQGKAPEWWQEEYLDKRDARLLRGDIADLENRIKTFSYPPNLERGLMVLGYLAVFGILLPVFIIAKNKFSLLAENIVTLAFSIGIIGVFAYIVLQIRALRRK